MGRGWGGLITVRPRAAAGSSSPVLASVSFPSGLVAWLVPFARRSLHHLSLHSRLRFPVVSRMPASRHSYFPPTVHSIAAGPIAIALRFAAPPRAVPLSIYAAVVGFLHRVRLSLYPPGFGFECVLLSPVTASFSARSSPDNVGGASACVASPALPSSSPRLRAAPRSSVVASAVLFPVLPASPCACGVLAARSSAS